MTREEFEERVEALLPQRHMNPNGLDIIDATLKVAEEIARAWDCRNNTLGACCGTRIVQALASLRGDSRGRR